MVKNIATVQESFIAAHPNKMGMAVTVTATKAGEPATMVGQDKVSSRPAT